MPSPTQGRIHNHQRMGPGVHLHRQQERDPEVTRQLLREREAEREREREREIALRERLAAEEEDLRLTTMWAREREHPAAAARAEVQAAGERDRSRSDSPGSRPSSGQSQSYERARPRVANLLAPEGEYYEQPREERIPASSSASNTRGYPSEGSVASAVSESRKRSHYDMEADDDHSGGRSPLGREGPAAVSAADVARAAHDMRISKRVHADEDVALGRMSSVRDEHMDQDD